MSVNAAKMTVSFMMLVLLSFSNSANALESQEGAKKFVEKVSHEALEVITSNDSAANKESKLTKLFLNSVDTGWIAHFAMGKYWRDATEQQRTEYTEKYKKFLLSHYIPKFKEYNNQEIKIVKSYPDSKNANDYIVESQIVPKDGAAINVDYKLRNKGGKFMVYDIVAEGVSLIATQRSDFASVLSRGGIDELIRMLGNKA